MSSNAAQQLFKQPTKTPPQGGKAFHFPQVESNEQSAGQLNPFAQALKTKGETLSPDIFDQNQLSPEQIEQQEKIAAHKKAQQAEREQQQIFDQRIIQNTKQIEDIRAQLAQLNKTQNKETANTTFAQITTESIETAQGTKGFFQQIITWVTKKPTASDNWLEAYQSKGQKKGPLGLHRAKGHNKTALIQDELQKPDKYGGGGE